MVAKSTPKTESLDLEEQMQDQSLRLKNMTDRLERGLDDLKRTLRRCVEADNEEPSCAPLK